MISCWFWPSQINLTESSECPKSSSDFVSKIILPNVGRKRAENSWDQHNGGTMMAPVLWDSSLFKFLEGHPLALQFSFTGMSAKAVWKGHVNTWLNDQSCPKCLGQIIKFSHCFSGNSTVTVLRLYLSCYTGGHDPPGRQIMVWTCSLFSKFHLRALTCSFALPSRSEFNHSEPHAWVPPPFMGPSSFSWH